MTEKLKPVPCGCGGEAEVKLWAEPETPYVVMCHKCGIVTEDFPTEAEAIEVWNRAMGAKDINVPNKERKKGKWVKVGHFGRSYKCDQCGNFLDFDGVNVGRGDANFCPNCGADMRGDHE